jgi:hypothetical protein
VRATVASIKVINPAPEYEIRLTQEEATALVNALKQTTYGIASILIRLLRDKGISVNQ